MPVNEKYVRYHLWISESMQSVQWSVVLHTLLIYRVHCKECSIMSHLLHHVNPLALMPSSGSLMLENINVLCSVVLLQSYTSLISSLFNIVRLEPC